MSFRVQHKSTGSAKSPSTPNRKAGKSSLFSQAPSTTPAGEPPSYLTNKSTTPDGRPPRSSKLFGSSYNASNNTFGHRGRAFAVPESSPPPQEEEDEDMDAEGEADDEGYGTQTGTHAQHGAFMSSVAFDASPRGLKRSRNGEVRDTVDSGMAGVARAYARDSGAAELHEGEDEVVLQTETVLSSLYATFRGRAIRERDQIITQGVALLAKYWRQAAKLKTRSGGIGPDADVDFSKANYLASLLLQLHSPHAITASPSVAQPQHSLVLQQHTQPSSIPIPKALLDWLNTYHKPLGDDFNEVHMHRPSPSAHESFWDLVGGELLRGQFQRVIRLLTDGGFEHAITALDDGSAQPGYQGKQLENVDEAISRFVRLLENCPAVRHDEWDIKGAEWSIFRQHVRHALKDLEVFAKGNQSGADEDDLLASRQSNIFAKSANPSTFDSMASASIRAGSRVPWSIYENLRVLYGVLVGGDEIVDYAQDWLESSVFLTVWWDGEDASSQSVGAAGRNSLRASRGHRGAGTREVDVSPSAAYRRRLADAFLTVTAQIEEANFKPDTLDPVQVGLACVLEDAVEASIALLQSWDQTIAVAVVDIAALGGWLPRKGLHGRGLAQQGFSPEDLMVLGHGAGHQDTSISGAVNRDLILTTYADLLATRDEFRSRDGDVREGWELAVSVLERLDDTEAAQARTGDLFESMDIDDERRVDKVLELCHQLGLESQASGIAERYADSLAGKSSNAFGSALIYYARANATQKLKATVSLLISLCLLQSAAVPSSSTMDAQLSSMLSAHRAELVSLADVDITAATLLSGQLSGYATIRRFYEVRDSIVDNASRSLERRREAATSLIAIIESASDCIRGGLFDPAVESVVPIDCLLALLGEALPLLGQQKRIFTREQVFTLMRVVEDFDTAPGRIRERAVELLRASMTAYHGGPVGSTTLRNGKTFTNSTMSGSGWSGSSSWDMVLSSHLLQSEGTEDEDAEIVRGWDWRKGLDAVVEGAIEGPEVLSLLRMALAQEVARGWAGIIRW